MKIIRGKDEREVGRIVAGIIADEINAKPDAVLGLATGSTPICTYEELVRKYKRGEIDFSKVCTVNLDEYKGLSPENNQSYRFFMNNQLFDHINIKKENTHLPDGLEEDGEKACIKYEACLRQVGAPDIQLLGLGLNGHIGFNEPSNVFSKTTHCVDLTESTIEANSRFFATMDDVPKQAYTMGIGSIMKARTIILIVTGAKKRDILHEVINGDVRPEVPATILQMHADVIVVADEAALGDEIEI